MSSQPRIRRKGEVIAPATLAQKSELEGKVRELERKLQIAEQENAEMRRLIADSSSEDAIFDSAFLDNLAHQLVAPLQCIESHCLNVYEGRVTGEKARNRLKQVIGHTKIISSMASRMRFLHQLTYNVQGAANVVTMQFQKVVTKIIDCHNNYLPISQLKNITVDIDTEPMNALPDVAADPIAIHQIFMNIFDNAMKYCSVGGTLRISGRRVAEKHSVEVTFSHPGIGVPEGEEERIFERGYRSSTATAVHAPGTGVGLWVCRRLMEAMEGEMHCVPKGKSGNTEFHLAWRIRQ